MRNALSLTAALALSACAFFEVPELPYVDAHAQQVVLPAGSRACFGPGVTNGACEALDRVANELDTPAMVSAICAAGADTLACRK